MPPALGLLARFFLLFRFVSLTISACAGSLVSGCYFQGHLFKTTMIAIADAMAKLSFGRPRAFILGARGMILTALGHPWEAKRAAKGTPRGPQLDF